MIKLVHLLPEQILYEVSATAQQAKNLGYTHAGGGNWRKGKSGPIIAKSKDGKLVPVKGADDKVTRQTKKKEAPGIGAAQQIYKGSGSKLIQTMKKTGAWEGWPAAIRHVVTKLSIVAVASPDRKTLLQVARVVNSEEFDSLSRTEKTALRKSMVDYVDSIKAAMKDSPPDPMEQMKAFASFGDEASKVALAALKDLKNKGIEVGPITEGRYSDWRNNDLHRTYARSHNLRSTSKARNMKLADEQGDAWRSKISDKELDTLSKNQRVWQESEIYRSRSKRRIYREINQLTRKYGTPDTGVAFVYRGISIPHKDAAQFLTNFSVGDTMVSPPSGYTTSHQIALGFGAASTTQHAVIFNMKGAGGNVKGLHLAASTEMGLVHANENMGENEQEVIIPSTHNQKVSGMETSVVRKVNQDGATDYAIITSISLVQDTEQSERKTMHEAKKPKPKTDKATRDLLDKYMGGSVNQKRGS